jgi:hypothetical protein
MVWHIFARLTRLIAQQHVDPSAPWGRRIPAQGNALGIRHATPAAYQRITSRHPTPCGVPTGRGKRVGPHSRGCTPGWYVDAPLGRGHCPSGPRKCVADCLGNRTASCPRAGARGKWAKPFSCVSSEFKRPNMPDQDACILKRGTSRWSRNAFAFRREGARPSGRTWRVLRHRHRKRCRYMGSDFEARSFTVVAERLRVPLEGHDRPGGHGASSATGTGSGAATWEVILKRGASRW